jgi:hypothetical protein
MISILFRNCMINVKCSLGEKYILLLKNNKLYTEFIHFSRKSKIIMMINIVEIDLKNVSKCVQIIV